MTTTQQSMPPVRPRQSTSPAFPRLPSQMQRRIRNNLRTVFARGDLSSLLVTWALLIVTALATDAAEWAGGLGVLTTVSVFSVGFGFLLARSHYSELLSLILSSVYSLAVIIVACSLTLVDGGTLWGRTDVLLSNLGGWLSDALANEQPENDDTAFVVFLAVLFWFLGHNAAWHVFRVDRVWRVIVPTGLVLITNQFYYQGDNVLDVYLVAFIVLSLLLLIRSHIEAREYDWYIHRVSFPLQMRRAFFRSGAVLSLVLVGAAWMAPAGEDDKSLDQVRELLTGETFADLVELWNRLFSSLEGEGIATANYYGGDELQLSGAIQLGDQPVMSVRAPFGPRYYWRSTVYDAYDFATWRWKHIRSVRAYTDESGLEFNIGATLPDVRAPVNQTVTVLLRSSDLIYAAPQPLRMGLPVEAELDCILDMGRTCVNEGQPADVAIIRARETLRRGDAYSVTSSVSTATAAQLRTAGTAYPDWVLRLYLQGAAQVSPRIQQLAVQIVQQAGAQTPYDQARAIEYWLRTNIQYNESIPAPSGNDAIEWFLFEQREGYCNYYATAMIQMLRTLGIPSRMAAGFAQGTWDPQQNAFLVRERDAHTWVEVYFPGYGWVEFEPTADEAPIDRQDDPVPQSILPTITPQATMTFTPAPTQTPQAPTPQSGALATPTSPAEAPFVPQTSTPTPPPTATPPPPPDVTRVDNDGGSSVLRAVLTTFGILLAIIVGTVLALAFVIWYVEYRGLGGLNIIQRAYARLAIYSRWLGFSLADSATPDERRRYLVSELPEGEQPINTITQQYIEDRYRPPATTRDDAPLVAVQNAWQQARWVFIRQKLSGFWRRSR